MRKGKKRAVAALMLLMAAALIIVPALADGPVNVDAYIPDHGIVTIPDQPVPITDDAASPPTGDDGGALAAILFAGACLSLTGFTAVRNREN